MIITNAEGDRLKTWNTAREKIIIIETITLIFAGLIILIGLICEMIASKGMAFIHVENINGLSLTVLQIQATLTTLVIAVVALLTGSISDSYMGISVSIYYMEIRPFVLKWKTVTVLEFALLGINVFSHIVGLYYIVLALFVFSLISLFVYTFEINDVFKGRNNSLKEIQEYYEWLIKTNTKYEENGKRFISDWKASIDDQSLVEYHEYFGMFMSMIYQSLNNCKNLKLVNSFAEEIALTLLESDSQSNRIKGIRFVEEYYDQIWFWINDNGEAAANYTDQIHLIDRIAHEWYVAVESLDADSIEKEVNLKRLAQTVIRVSACLGYDEQKSKSEPNAIFSIARAWGSVLDKQIKKGCVVDFPRWERVLIEHYGYHSFGIPENAVDFFLNSYALYDFFICYGYLLNGKTEIVKNAVFLDDIGNLYKVECKAYLYKTMLIHCFTYYLGFKESTECVDESIKKLAYELVIDSQVVESMSRFYLHLLDSNHLLSEDLESDMEELLRHYELFPKHSNGKVIIIEEIVRDYFLYISLLIYRYTYKREKLIELLNVDKYFSYLFDNKKKDIISRLIEIGSLFGAGGIDESTKIKNAEEMYGIFESVMHEKYKKEIIDDASVNQKEYEEGEIREITKVKIKQILTEKFVSLFGEMTSSLTTHPYKKIQVMSSLDYTKFLGENLRDVYSDYPFANFMGWLCKELKKSFGAETINRDEKFKSDSEFREYLENEKFDLLLGSSYTFCCEDYNDYKAHNEYLRSNKVIYVPTTGFGIALRQKNVCIRLDSVNVDIYSPTIEEVNAIRNDETGLYSYSPLSGLKMDFEEGELREYIHDERKIIRVYFDVSIGIKEEDEQKSCVIITRND